MKRQSDGISWRLFNSPCGSFIVSIEFLTYLLLTLSSLRTQRYVNLISRTSPHRLRFGLGLEVPNTHDFYQHILSNLHPHSFYSYDFSIVPIPHVVALRYDILRVAGADPGPIAHA